MFLWNNVCLMKLNNLMNIFLLNGYVYYNIVKLSVCEHLYHINGQLYSVQQTALCFLIKCKTTSSLLYCNSFFI